MTISDIGSSLMTPYSVGLGNQNARQAEESKPVVNPGESDKVSPGKKSSPAECQTCKNRKYQDGSNESDVSFKAPTHISPGSSTGAAMAHEQMHVSNAYEKASKNNGKVLQASVQLKMAVCPECGRVYCAGGTTTTKIAYKSDQYSQNRKSVESLGTAGANFDAAV